MVKLSTHALVLAGILAITAERVGERDRSESTAIGVLRAIASAQESYRAATGAYALLECLTGAVCDGKASGVFLAPGFAARGERQGYRFDVYAGRGPVVPGQRRQPAMTRFAVVAVPNAAVTNASSSFCVDTSGVIYVTSGGATPRVEAASCSDTTRPLNGNGR